MARGWWEYEAAARALRMDEGERAMKVDGTTTPKRGQRNFLGIYDLMLKTLQLDYACCARYEASGYADFIGKLYTLNANMFQSQKFCDRTLTQMMLHYLTWFQDPGMQLVVGPGAAWHVRQDFRTQRYGDVLYVVSAEPGAQVSVGEAITRVNGMTLDEVRPEVERTLWTTVEPADPEREDWSVVLAFAKHLTVRGVDGAERVIKVDGAHEAANRAGVSGAEGAARLDGAGDARVAACDGAGEAAGDGVRAAMTADGAACDCAADGAGGRAAADAPCSLAEVDGVGVLTLRNPADPTFCSTLAALLPAAQAAERLVVDVRGCRGGVQEDIYPLVPLVLAPGAVGVGPERLFGPAGIVMNYSRHNADAKLAELAALRAQLVASAGTADVMPDPAEARETAAPGPSAPAREAAANVPACEAAAPGSGDVALSDAASSADPVASELAELDAFEADLRAKRGHGFVHELCGPDDGFYPEGLAFDAALLPSGTSSRTVVVLTDRFTGEAAEWLVRAARQAGHATLVGRATIGSLDTTCPRAVRLDEDYTLIVPTATYDAAHEGMATLGRGIVPDVHLPWTPDALTRDTDLESACARAREA